VHTASLGGSGVTGALAGLFSETFSAPQQHQPIAAALAGHIASHAKPETLRRPNLIAPDLEHVADVFTTPDALTSDHFAVIWDHDEADFSPATELGSAVPVLRAGDFPEGLSHTQFVAATPVSAATN
jgi:hypothetical protein